MFENLSQRFAHFREVFGAMSPAKKFLLLGGLAAALAAFTVLMVWANQTEYKVLYANLEQEDAGAIVEKLNERKTPYRLSQDGSTIEVPKDLVQESRLSLATEGLPVGGSVGMEMFNETKLGETDFLQHLNYQRALQGELERTIKKFDVVEQARVHLNIPKESLFIEEERPPSASVVLSLKRGKNLTRSQIQGIVHLVASSVEGLTDENITVVDTSGGLIYSKDIENQTALSPTQTEYRKQMEQNMSNRVTSMLERIIGPNKVLSRVSADLTFQTISTSEEIYDPDRAVVRSEQRLQEINQGPAKGASGIPQSSFELGTGNQSDQAQAQGESYQRTEDTTNYEITRINRQTVTTPGEVKKLSVAVMVDGIYPDNARDANGQKVFQPRPQAELDQLTQLVKNAIGFDETRGDSVVVESVPFYLPETPPLTWWEKLLELARLHGKTAINVLLVFLFFVLVARPILAWLKQEAALAQVSMEPPLTALPEGEQPPEALPEYGGVPEAGAGEPGRVTREQILELAKEHPTLTLNLVRSWIEEG